LAKPNKFFVESLSFENSVPMDGIQVKGVNFKSKRRHKCKFDPKFLKKRKWKIGVLHG
jgi:hypothetical protein